jgi:hypothetical protein
MSYHLRKLAAVLLASAILSGCAGVPTTVGSKVNASLPTGTAREISGTACGFQLLLFIPININDRLQKANAQLTAEAAGDFITDVQIQESWSYGFVGTSYCTTLKAQAIKAK